MGVCESKNNQQAATPTTNTAPQPTNTAANATQNQGGVLGNLFGSNTNQQQAQQQNTGVVDTIKNAFGGSNQTNQQQQNTGVVDTIKNAFGGSNQTNQQQSGGVVDTIKNAFGGSNQTNQQQSGGVVDTIKNAFGGSNQNTTTNANPTKAETVAKVVQFGVENKEALGKLVS